MDIRSCEYTTIPKLSKTKLLQLKDIRFFVGIREIIKTREVQCITFYRYKKGVKEAMISMHQSNDRICPVRAFWDLTIRILSYPGENLDSTVNTVSYENIIMKTTPKVTLHHIRNTAALICSNMLDFGPNDVGNHYMSSPFVMFLILNGVEEIIVQLQGRWKRRAFMDYLRSQVNQLSKELTK